MVEKSIESLSSGEKSQLEDLTLANQILALKEILDGFGHVSVRSIDRPDRYLLSRSMAPSLIREHDIRLFDLESTCTTEPHVGSYLERFIHGEIYRARPDVQAIVHAHTPSVLPFGLVPGVPLRPVSHTAGFIGDHLPIFEIRHVDERSDMLIRNGQLGAALAEDLGDSTAVLMRGHGDISQCGGGRRCRAVERCLLGSSLEFVEARNHGDPARRTCVTLIKGRRVADYRLRVSESHWHRRS